LECRGHGASDIGPYTDLSIKTFANDLASHIGSPSIVGGISMGAAISLHLAVHHKARVKALVLARPAWVVDAAPDNMKPNAEVGELLARFSIDEAKARFLESDTAYYLKSTAPDNLTSLLGFFSRQPFDDTSALLTRISSDGPGVSDAEVRNIKVPTLIIATEQDAVHPVVHAENLHALIPNSRLVLITPKGVDKASYVHEFQSTLLTFLEEHAQ
jgi:pimeloyl-ACP methyl ester carboxylesterase